MSSPNILASGADEITLNAKATGESLKMFEEAPDPTDRATQEETRTLELKTRDRERKLLRKVESSLIKVSMGTVKRLASQLDYYA